MFCAQQCFLAVKPKLLLQSLRDTIFVETHSTRPHGVCVTGTWLQNNSDPGVLDLKVVTNLKKGRGGVAVYVRSDINFFDCQKVSLQ